MRIKEYTTLFRELASRHVDIRHTDKECRFMRATLSADGLGRHLDLKELYDSLRTKLKSGYFLVLQSYEIDFEDNVSDNLKKIFHGAIIVLGKAKTGDYDGQEEVLDRTEEIGEDIMGAVLHRWQTDFTPPIKVISARDITSEKVGPVGDNFFGTRFNFSFSEAANGALKHKPSKFLN
ncbi:hypothetical protein HUW51_17165 [Adhaeribacter swui]|uniref:Uncharacterized protein n=1 Tax=Adhaeribacter swui TaxID=2086471 RepID=A0A7G7GB34_9BACT|nr:hypothetical protein [Adhaeribacter swui]QNF34368.1 hypothetical protein HUW51_17165 [Adhaeribacter swui]